MKRWKIVNKGKGEAKGLKMDKIIKILLENRGLKTKKQKEEFLNPKLETVTPKSVGIDLKELKKALKRIVVKRSPLISLEKFPIAIAIKTNIVST